MVEYSFCESVHAGPQSRWHIRELTDKGRKLGGGIDTLTLCGRPMDGWDVNVPVVGQHLTHCCPKCREAYDQAEADLTAKFDAVLEIREKIIKQLGSAAVVNKTSTKTRGTIVCPVCGGKLAFSFSHYNGHIHGCCETEECLSWVE